MRVTVKYFGMIAEQTSLSQEVLNIPNDITTIEELELWMLSKHPSLKKITYNIAQNQKITSKNQALKNDDILAFLPPFAGG